MNWIYQTRARLARHEWRGKCLDLLWTFLLWFGLLFASHPASAAKLRVEADAARGYHDKPFSVQLHCKAPKAKILYTLDGIEPSLSAGRIYEGSLNVSSNTLLRAAAFDGARQISTVSTYSYLFPLQIVHQPARPPGVPTRWHNLPAAYGMDPRVVDDPAYSGRIEQALRALPILSVVCRQEDLFDEGKGIYLNTMEKGAAWEKPCSVEFIPAGNEKGFQIDCGLRIQGNMNRVPGKCPKHSFRLVFTGRYGPAKLNYRLFPDSPVKKFDTLVLRADYNSSWVHWDASVRPHAQRIRDAWMKDSHREMGWVAPHNRYMHLYLNGLYWGIYDASERPDASFAAAYWGGNRDDYDVVNEFQANDGTLEGFQALHSLDNFRNPDQYDLLQKRLNLTEYIDYLLLNYYAGNRDWGELKNWYAIRRRAPSSPFQYIVWDGEQVLLNLDEDAVNDPYEAPSRLALALRLNPDFCLAFADRVQKHFFGNGALTPRAVTARWMKRSAEVDQAVVAESARWGYYRRNPPYTRDREWISEQRRLLNSYFPKRTEVVLEQLRAAGLYPKVSAPTLNGSEAGGELKLVIPERETVYFTTNGADPRVPGKGTVASNAVHYSGPIPVKRGTVIKARILKDGAWSALAERALEKN